MNRLKKELISRHIIFQNDGGYEDGRELVALTDKFIITVWFSNVLPTEIHLFDRNFNQIGTQLLFPEDIFFSEFSEGRTWWSYVFGEEERK